MRTWLLAIPLLFIGLITFAQAPVTGAIKDSAGNPVVGASVKIKGQKYRVRPHDAGWQVQL